MIYSRTYDYELGSLPRPEIVMGAVIGTTFQNMGASGTATRWGEQLLSGVSTLRGKTITSTTFYLQKVGTPSGTLNCNARDSSGAVIVTMGSMNVSGLTVAELPYTFNAVPWTVKTTDTTYLFVEFSGNSATNYVQVKTRGADSLDSGNTRLSWFSGTGFFTSQNEDVAIIINGY